MKITVDDRAPGAGAGRNAYLEDRTRRVLGRMSDRMQSIALSLRSDDRNPGHHRVDMIARMRQGENLAVSVHRRLLPDALADAFDALVTRIALSGFSSRAEADAIAFVRPSTPNADRRRSL